jgi:hypothetical protein
MRRISALTADLACANGYLFQIWRRALYLCLECAIVDLEYVAMMKSARCRWWCQVQGSPLPSKAWSSTRFDSAELGSEIVL